MTMNGVDSMILCVHRTSPIIFHFLCTIVVHTEFTNERMNKRRNEPRNETISTKSHEDNMISVDDTTTSTEPLDILNVEDTPSVAVSKPKKSKRAEVLTRIAS